MPRRAQLLEFAILGLLHESPMHGYELRRRLNTALGAFRALSYGALYPALRTMLDRSWITPVADASGGSGSRRARIVYQLTAAGKEHFEDLVAEAGPATWEDDEFDVHLAFFARTTREVRLRILEGRRSRLEQRLAQVRETSVRNRERMDAYTAAIHRHGEESAEREVRWLDELIRAERDAAHTGTHLPGSADDSTYPSPRPKE